MNRNRSHAASNSDIVYRHTRCQWWLAVLFIACTTACHNTPHAPVSTAEAEAHSGKAVEANPFAGCTMHYVWSPRMVLSAQHATAALTVAEKMKMRFRIHHPADIPDAEISATLTRLLPEHPRSATLLHASTPIKPIQVTGHVFNHYPTVWLQRDRQRTGMVTGAMPEPYWNRTLQQLRQALQCR